jgi:hypothetical protein
MCHLNLHIEDQMCHLKLHIEDQILRRQGTKFKRHFKLAPGICAVMTSAYFIFVCDQN